ncbi:hypothetical protein [Prauserella sp. PE36]|uniref:hypothetical protein n=1 Tax=Prauserella sp. PE36 TaxID=1504709 RepID=UPI0011BD9C13|nr:hypothetical protein [Prauserella sp. PE36]
MEDPDAEQNREMGMGDDRAAAWSDPFDNMTARDGALSQRHRFGRGSAVAAGAVICVDCLDRGADLIDRALRR